jgi:CBS domain containing-hemolysin-like protein
MIGNILLTLFFVLLNAFFVAAEFAIVKVRASQIELRLRTGSKMAGLAKDLITHLDSYLSATQLGITLASLGLGWIGESVVAGMIRDIIGFLGLTISETAIHSMSLPIAFGTITALHIVFGELAPKSLALQRPEQVTLAISLPLKIFYLVFKPIIWSLNAVANWFVKLMGLERITEEGELHSAEELQYILNESSKSGLIESTEHQILENVFGFSETPVKQIMVPHNRIVGVEISMPPEDIMIKFIEDGYSRMPVYEDTIDNILGVIYAKDLISMMNHRELIIIQDIIRPTFYVGEDEKISILLRRLQKERVHMALVMDEFGGTAGIVTLEDILEELVGEIQDEYDEEKPDFEEISDNIFTVEASATISDVNDQLPYPLPESEDYETVGGMITNYTGRIPETGEIIILDKYKCEIIKGSERRIELVKLIAKL